MATMTDRSYSAGSTRPYQLGAAGAAFLGGVARGDLGSYTPVWLAAAVLCVLAALMAVLIKRQPVTFAAPVSETVQPDRSVQETPAEIGEHQCDDADQPGLPERERVDAN